MTWDLRRHAPLVALCAALVLSAWLRLTSLPQASLYGDEAQYSIIARNMIDQPWYPHYSLNHERVTAFVSQPPLVLWAVALGQALHPEPETGARMAVGVIGVLGVLAAYLLGREAYGPWTGAVAAGLVAIAPMHVHLSRAVFLDVPLATFSFLAMWLVLRWVRTGTRTDAILAGVATALAVLTKMPGALVPVVIAVFLVAQGAREVAHAGGWRRAREGSTIVRALTSRDTVLALCVGATLFVLVIGVWFAMIASSGMWPQWTNKVLWHADRVVSGGGGDSVRPWWYYFEGEGSLPGRMGANLWYLGLFGLLYAAVAWMFPRAVRGPEARPLAGDALLLVYVAVYSAFFLLSARKVWFYVLPLVPALTLLGSRLAVDLVRAADRAWRRWAPARTPTAARPFPALAVVAVVLFQVGGPTFGHAMVYAAPTDGVRWGDHFAEACDWVRENREEDQAMMSSLLGRYSLGYYCPDVPVFDRFRVDLTHRVAQGQVRYLVLDPYYQDAKDLETFGALRSIFPTEHVASFGGIAILEFRPTNLTIRIEPTKDAYSRSAGEVAEIVVTIGNPRHAEPRNLSGVVANLSVHRYTDKGWPFRIHHEEVPLEAGVLPPGGSVEIRYVWDGRSYWSKGQNAKGWHHLEVVIPGEHGFGPRFWLGP